MVNIQKQVEHWRDGAREDWEVGAELVREGRIRHGLFFVHLAMEKALKAHVCRATQDLAPRNHDLPYLARAGQVTLDEEKLRTLAEVNTFNIEGRYPHGLPAPPQGDAARELLHRATEVFEWLIQLL